MAAAQEQEFTVRVPPRDERKKYHVMKFNASLNIDFSKWTQARMVRENNQKILNQQPQDDDPKFGAGSVFGKDVKEEARRKKLGITRKVYDPEAQPWLMRVGGKGGRKYKGIREGGVSNNTTFYVFTHGKDGAFEAFPIKDWYNFTPIQRYKTLDAEEAEERFANRGKVLNKWSVMVHRKLKPDQEDAELDGEEGEKKGKKGAEKKDFKISDMDEWEGSDDGLDTDEEKEKKDDSDDDGKSKKRSKDSKKKNKKKEVEDEAFDDSEDDDRQDREVDYMSDESSDSEEEEEEKADAKGVDQDEGLSKMLDSDESSDEDKDKDKDKDDEDDEDETGKKKKKKSSSRGNSDDEEEGKGKKKGSTNNSRSGTPTKDVEKVDKAEKRKAMVANLLDPNAEAPAKKSRLEQFGNAAPGAMQGNEAISEEAVRRYLKRRPMTTTDLLKKFRSKKTGIQNAQLVQLLANILKKINPHKHKVKGVTYLSLKEEK